MALAYGDGRFANRLWRRGREAEGDGLLNRYRGNPIVGSNPTVSAKLLFANPERDGAKTGKPCYFRRVCENHPNLSDRPTGPNPV